MADFTESNGGTKQCSRCGTLKAIGDFYRRGANGVRSRCKVCESDLQRERQNRPVFYKEQYASSDGKVLARLQAWRAANPDKVRQQQQRAFERNREACLRRSREWKLENPERVRKYRHQRYWSDPEAARQEVTTRRRDDPERAAEIQARSYRKNYAKNKPKYVARNKERQALLRGGTRGDLISLPKLAERDGWRCHLCGGKVTKATWSMDHLIPVSQGGAHSWENVSLAHLRCNQKRGTSRLPAQLRLLG